MIFMVYIYIGDSSKLGYQFVSDNRLGLVETRVDLTHLGSLAIIKDLCWGLRQNPTKLKERFQIF